MGTPTELPRGLFPPGRPPQRSRGTFRPGGLCGLERRDLLTHPMPGGGALVELVSASAPDGWPGRRLPSSAAPDRGFAVLPASEYYPQAIPTSDRSGITSSSPIWGDAQPYLYGPSPDERFWVIIPPAPTGKLDLIVHSGGLQHGSPTAAEIVGLALRDLDQGITVVSLGYRTLTTSAWPTPVDDIARAVDTGVQVAQDLTGGQISDITETGLSAGGTALVLINYSALYPTTTVRPDRLITISAPLEANAVPTRHPARGGFYTHALRWGGNIPKANIPITLMGTRGDPIALEKGRTSNIREFTKYLLRYNISVSTYMNYHDRGQHGRTAEDFQQYPDVAAALQRAYDYNG